MNLVRIMEIMRENAVKIALIQNSDGTLDIYNDKMEKIGENLPPDSAVAEASSLSDIYLYCHNNICSLFRNDDIVDVFEVE